MCERYRLVIEKSINNIGLYFLDSLFPIVEWNIFHVTKWQRTNSIVTLGFCEP